MGSIKRETAVGKRSELIESAVPMREDSISVRKKCYTQIKFY